MCNSSQWVVVLLATVGVAFPLMTGCGRDATPQASVPQESAATPDNANENRAQEVAPDQEHGHKPSAHGGILVSLGRDSYHIEAIVEKSGALKLYTLGQDETRVIEIESQDLIAYVKPEGATESVQIDVKPRPQPGDKENKASLFVGQLPEEALGKTLDITIPNIAIAGERFRMGFTTHTAESSAAHMPEGVEGSAARDLYLSPGGIYTMSDIEANGNVTADHKFKGIKAAHDLQPVPGDKLCPVTLTKANAKFSWIVAGKEYEFCCPPCIDEFVGLAKSYPDQIRDPDFYVKRAAGAVQDSSGQ